MLSLSNSPSSSASVVYTLLPLRVHLWGGEGGREGGWMGAKLVSLQTDFNTPATTYCGLGVGIRLHFCGRFACDQTPACARDSRK